ncbi:MAG: hypothetical protein JWO02_1515 [Solirubrobacterales bacterium]|nr:hypothetical protein [Solirubrobacterales bacterium]
MDTQHPRPMDRDFYVQAREAATAAQVVEQVDFDEPGAFLLDLGAGETASIELLSGAQIVNLLPFNTADPDERLWAHETCLLEGLWLTRYSRLWGTMARFRPLLTILEDTVVTPRRPGEMGAHHHPVYGGAGTPASWKWAGGREGTLTTWEQFAAALATRALPTTLIKDNACLFQKTRLDAPAQRLDILASDAVTGDRVTLFAEVDVTLMLALSPYVDGASATADIDESPRPVRITRTTAVAQPLGWPYPDMGYPDLALYLDETGTRATEAVPTPGREAILS